MSMGKGAMVNISRKHKLNVGSSAESELVSIANVLGMMIWYKYFMDHKDTPSTTTSCTKITIGPFYWPRTVGCQLKRTASTSRILFF